MPAIASYSYVAGPGIVTTYTGTTWFLIHPINAIGEPTSLTEFEVNIYPYVIVEQAENSGIE